MSELEKYINNNFNPKRPSTCIVSLKKNKNGMLNELVKATLFLNNHYNQISVNQRLFHYLNKINYVQFCKYCDSPLQVKTINARLVGSFYNGTCESKECRSKFNGDQTRLGFIKNYGVENISQTIGWKEKVKKTNFERRGVAWNTQSKEFIKLVQASIKSNLPSVIKKRRETYVKNSLEKYGTVHPMQDAKIFKRSTDNYYRKKEYTFPSGKKVFVQGYEPIVLNELIKKYQEDDILTDSVDIENIIGKIYYQYNSKKHRYYPDIYIISENKIIEVKSQYTYEINIEINLAKQNACIKNGLDFIFEIR